MLFAKRFQNKSIGVLTAGDFKKRSTRILYWALFATLLVVSIVCLFPPLWIFMSAFKDTKEFLSVPPTLIPKTFNISKLTYVWNTLDFWKYYRNSFLLLAGEWACCILFNGVFGFVLSRVRPKGTKLIFTIVFWTMLMPASVNMIPLFMTFCDLPLVHANITNTYFPMWIMAAANAYYTLLFRSFFNGIPMSYVEAAKMDGCSMLGIFFKIIVPLSTPIIIVVSIFSIQNSWGSFLWPFLVVKNAKLFPITVKLYQLFASGLSEDVYFVAMLLTIIPPAILFSFLSKYIMNANLSEGIKG